MKLEFEIFSGKTFLAVSDYAFLEENFENWKFYFYNVSEASDVIVNEGDVLNIVDHTYGCEVFSAYYTITVTKKALIKDGDCIVLDCAIDTDDLFFNYDQHRIDMRYYFDDDNYRTLRKQQKVYNFACRVYTGFPETLGTNKTVTIDCSKIQTEYYFYTLIAEGFLGDKAYMGAGSDSFDFCLEAAKCSAEDNNVVHFLNYDNTVRIDEEVFDILKKYGITVNFI